MLPLLPPGGSFGHHGQVFLAKGGNKRSGKASMVPTKDREFGIKEVAIFLLTEN